MPRRLTIASIVYEQAICGDLGDRRRRLLPDRPPRPAGPAAALGGAAADPAGDRAAAPARLRAAGEPGAAGLRPRAAAGGDVAARRDRRARLLRAQLGRGRGRASTASPARSATSPPSDILIVGSAQAFGYVAALVTLVAPAGLGIRDAAFAWAVKVAAPGGSFAVGSLIAIAVRGRDDGGRDPLRGGGDRAWAARRAGRSPPGCSIPRLRRKRRRPRRWRGRGGDGPRPSNDGLISPSI